MSDHSLLAQVDTGDITKIEFLKASAKYRSEIIGGIKSTISNFHLLIDSLKAVSESPDGHEKIREKFMTKSNNWFSDSDDKQPFFMYGLIAGVEGRSLGVYRKWLKENAEYFQEYLILAGQDFIEQDPPYKLSDKNQMWEDFQFYQIRDGMTLVDIGTGFGHFPFIVAFTGFNGKMIMTEIDEEQLEFLNTKMKTFDLSEINCQLEIIKGDKADASLQNIKADKIFMRETFHHIKFKEEMLNSLKANLKENGFLYVIENVRDFVPNLKDSCRKIIYKLEIITAFEAAGYKLVEERSHGQNVMLKFSL